MGHNYEIKYLNFEGSGRALKIWVECLELSLRGESLRAWLEPNYKISQRTGSSYWLSATSTKAVNVYHVKDLTLSWILVVNMVAIQLEIGSRVQTLLF